MNRFRSAVRRPVRRVGAEQYLIITLFSFAVSVSLTRLFLEITGYPQIGGEKYHIAHVLWGGLLLFIAALLPLLYANRWSYTVGAVLTGAGVGLFIDEVGKFITANNDYFSPLAAPIIYASFLLVVLIYLQVKRAIPREPRSELFTVLDALEEVVEHDLDEQEYAELINRLNWIGQQEKNPELARFARGLQELLQELHIKPEMPSSLERLIAFGNQLADRWFARWRLRAILVGGLLALCLVSLSTFVEAIKSGLLPTRLDAFLELLITRQGVSNLNTLYWLLARTLLELIAALLMLAAACFLAVGKDRHGVFFGNLAIIFSLTVVNLLVFYFDQFSTIILAVVQFTLFLMLALYKHRFAINGQPTQSYPSATHGG